MHTHFFSPSSVVIVGASSTDGKIGNDMLKNLASYTGEKYGINPKKGGIKIHNMDIFSSLKELPEIPEMAVIVIPSLYVASSLKECGEVGIKNVVIISAGFKEMGNAEEEQELVRIAKKYDIDILGPNCLGFLNPHLDLNLSFASSANLKKGNVALVSQSGAMAVAMMDWASTMNIGFSKIISMGNKSDIHENDFLEYLEHDEQTDVIVLYLESIVDGREFYKRAQQITKTKPIIVVKSGISKKGALAASSHTGALSGAKEILETALTQAGVHSTHSLKTMFLWTQMFANARDTYIPRDLIIITNAGGPGVMSVDNAEKYVVPLHDISKDDEIILNKNMPLAASMKNPLDILGDANSIRYKQILENLEELQQRKNINNKNNFGILLLLTPQTVTDTENIANEIIIFQKNNPSMFIMTSFMGGKSVEGARKILQEQGILHFDYPQEALEAFSRLQIQKQWETSITNFSPEDQCDLILGSGLDIDNQSNILSRAPILLPPDEVSQLFEKHSIPFAKEILLTSEDDIEKIYNTNQKGVMKISSPDIAHKTDIGGVILGIDSLENAKKSYNQILESVKKHLPNARINGVTYQALFPKAREVFVGMTRDETFGEVIVFGLGGIYLNVFEDVVRRVSPLSRKEIQKMITEIQSYPLLKGARGENSIHFEALEDIIFKISCLFHSHAEIREIDINPIFCFEDSAHVMDAKIFV